MKYNIQARKWHILDIRKIADQIDSLEKYVQSHTNSYMLDADCSCVIDAQLNGHICAIKSYCNLNNLSSFSDSIGSFTPIDDNAIEFFCFWDGIKADLIEHSETLQGKQRQYIVSQIACELQETMTRDEINTYLGGFGVPISSKNCTVNSKRIYVENTLKTVDGITIMNIAKDMCILSADVVEVEIENKLCSNFVVQQISKCKRKMNSLDYDGAITNARTLVEEILLSIEEIQTETRQSYDGNLLLLYKRVAKQINMYPDDKNTGNSFNEILRGFISIINGLAGVSNNIADRHATVKHPQKHHAKMAVNSAMVISEFLIESFEYQQRRANR